ncbi:MAG: glycine--tRNA ligase subunit beta [Steroidobacteraceae bacterium]
MTARIERRDFLVELGTEELPPKTLTELERAFGEGVRAGLAHAGIAHGELRTFATPRRLAVLVKRVAAHQPARELRRRGPPVNVAFDASGNPTRAALAFAEGVGVGVETLQRITEGKGEFLLHVGVQPGASTASLLPDIVRNALDQLPIAKRMRWGAGDAEFVRPVHWLIMLFGNETVAATVLDTAAGSTTRGHRFHAPRPIRIVAPASYARVLAGRGRVLADFAERRARVREHVDAHAAALGGRAMYDDALLDEVTALVEWPVAIAGRFEERFLALPREVLISTLQDHQRYFPVEGAGGALTAWFITVSNIESRDPAKVRAGNERVVRPRLADAAFFWEQDRKAPLASRIEALAKVTFQTKLGSLADKMHRVRALAADIARALRTDVPLAQRAAELAKCDLLSAMVGEFPGLQGTMGSYYAAADKEPAEVAQALREQYLPRFAGDELPRTDAGTALAIADRLDMIVGIFAIGQKPSGTKDPFGLRRSALGILRIIIEKRLDLDLSDLIARAVALVRERLPDLTVSALDVEAQVYEYIMERLRAYYLESAEQFGVTTERFDAVLATRPRAPLDFDARLRALAGFLALPEAASLTAANKRIANILRKSAEPGAALPGTIEVAALREPAEIALHDALRSVRDSVAGAVERREYAGALGRLAQLRPTVDAFFDGVMVMDADPKRRGNRVALLSELQRLFGGIADLSRLPG